MTANPIWLHYINGTEENSSEPLNKLVLHVCIRYRLVNTIFI